MHVPRVTAAFLVRELLLRRRGLSDVRWRHVLACLIAPLIGIGRPYFGYHLITARRR